MLPAPLTPQDCDLRGFDYMPLFGHRLFASELYTGCSDREFRAAVLLWWIAWQQCPAGSLPSDDNALALMADFGRDLKGWRRARPMALRGFIMCSDDRLYHPMLCGEAIKAFAMRTKHKYRRETDRQRLRRWRETHLEGGNETAGETRLDLRRQERTRQDQRSPPKTPKGEGIDENAQQLPGWMPLDPWSDFVAMRTAMRKPLQGRARDLLISKLQGFHDRGVDVAEALNSSTMARYQGVFEPRKPFSRPDQRSTPTRLEQEWQLPNMGQAALDAAEEPWYGAQ